jgi:putative ABC transport system substrate-binding protein
MAHSAHRQLRIAAVQLDPNPISLPINPCCNRFDLGHCRRSFEALGKAMRRRDVIKVIVGSATVWPLVASAQQQSGKLPTIGFLGAGTSAGGQGSWVSALVQRLRELGWNEGSNIAFESRWADTHDERLTEMAAEFVRLKVDVIVAVGTQAAVAAKRATSTIPIVFPASGDPVGAGLVVSLARPGGNATGSSLENIDLTSKRVALLREVVPGLRRLAIMANVDSLEGKLNLKEASQTAGKLGLEIVPLEIRRAEDIAPSFVDLSNRADALYVAGDPLVVANRVRINTLALIARLPTVYNSREYVELGGLMSYGPNFLDLFRRGADFVDKILRGAKATDLPVEQPTKFYLVVNLTTAKGLKLTIPESFLALADEVIE